MIGAAGTVPVVVGLAAEITMSALVPDRARSNREITDLTLEARADSKCIEDFKASSHRGSNDSVDPMAGSEIIAAIRSG